MTNAEIGRYLSVGNFECMPNEHQPDHLRARILPDGELLSLMGLKAKKKAGMRLATVQAYRELLGDETKNVSRTTESLKPHLGAIKLRVGEILAEGQPEDSNESLAVPKRLDAMTVLEWERKERRFGLAGLYDKITEFGKEERLAPYGRQDQQHDGRCKGVMVCDVMRPRAAPVVAQRAGATHVLRLRGAGADLSASATSHLR